MYHLGCFLVYTYSVEFLERVDLAQYSTMRLGGTAAFLCTARSVEHIIQAVAFANERRIAFKVIGEGSNIIWSGDYHGLIIINALLGIQIQGTSVLVQAGEPWDHVVATTVAAGLYGLECLSLIPGTTGATPVQNVGAYGTEVSQYISQVHVYDTTTATQYSLTNTECNFGYRSSRFNTYDAGRFIITAVEFTLHTTVPRPPFYTALEHYFIEHAITEYSAQIIRDAVITIRQSKLPDPKVIANTGSFFKNPIVSITDFKTLKATHPTIPHWEVESGIKLSAGWLMEQAGFKGYTDTTTGMGTYKHHALVLVNYTAKNPSDLLECKQHIISTVQAMFGVTLVQEPELV
jgi:UDP-N-acetylmuramate dehydrogenase